MLAPACWNSAVGTRGCLSSPGPSSQMAVPLLKNAFPAAGLCHPLPGMVPATKSPTLLGHTGVAPKDKQQQGAGSRAGRRGPPSGARVLPKPMDTNA